ncbi:MAG TPA: SIMPL domain-containing protein [Candidatus Pacearchaeota archaeon]|nr:SIMPL domain-containing protein [Candidatus Pacearchaeota archaeon]
MENQNNNVCGIGGCPSGPCRIVVGALAIALAVYVAALAVNAIKSNKYIGRQVANQATISVSGDGEVYKTPDLAVMSFSVVSESKTVAEAMEDNTKKMNAITDVMKSMGVAENDLQTTNFSINPRYDYVRAAVPAPASADGAETAIDGEYYYPSGKRTLSGYDVNQTLTIKIRQENMGKIGQIIQEATASGANQVGSLQFTLDDPDAAQAEARELAIVEAKEKAEILAKQLNVKLVRIISYNDGGYSPTYRLNYDAKEEAYGMGGAASVPAPDIQAGESKISMSVNITYEIE